MSLLFPERVVAKVGASEVSLNGETIPCDPAYGAEPWQGALAALSRVARAHGGRVQVSPTVVTFVIPKLLSDW